jgi:predicted mannosyl-3-phosphoglycerate phosphatase (HAD superfamily)
LARQFTNEPCFSDLAGTMQKKGLAAFAAKPLLKRVEKMSFHILKVATKCYFQDMFERFIAWMGWKRGWLAKTWTAK